MMSTYPSYPPVTEVTWRIPIGMPAPFMNSNERKHWTSRSENTAAWRYTAGWRVKAAKIPRLEHAWIQVHVSFGDKRRRDPSNYARTAKAIVDGIVDAGVLPDDNPQYVTGPDMRLGTDSKRGALLIISARPIVDADLGTEG